MHHYKGELLVGLSRNGEVIIGAPTEYEDEGLVPIIGFKDMENFQIFIESLVNFYEENRAQVPEVWTKAWRDEDAS